MSVMLINGLRLMYVVKLLQGSLDLMCGNIEEAEGDLGGVVKMRNGVRTQENTAWGWIGENC